MKQFVHKFSKFINEQNETDVSNDSDELGDLSFLSDLGFDPPFDEYAIANAINKYPWRNLLHKRIISSVKFKEIQIVPGSSLYNSLPWKTRERFTAYTTFRQRRGSTLKTRRKKKDPQKPTVFFGKTTNKWDLNLALDFYKNVLKKEESDLALTSKNSKMYISLTKRNIKSLRKLVDTLNKLISLDRYLRVNWTFIIFNNDDYLLEKDDPNEPYKGIVFSVSASVTHPINKSEIYYKKDSAEEEYIESYEKALAGILYEFDSTGIFEYFKYNKKDEYQIIFNLIKAYKHRKNILS
jgi:hypothetical protein